MQTPISTTVRPTMLIRSAHYTCEGPFKSGTLEAETICVLSLCYFLPFSNPQAQLPSCICLSVANLSFILISLNHLELCLDFKDIYFIS